MNRCFLTTKTFRALAAILVAISVGSVNTTVRAQSDDTIVVKVNDTSITLKDLDNTIVSKLIPLQRQIHALRRAALENLIVRAVLEGEAKKKSISVEDTSKSKVPMIEEPPAAASMRGAELRMKTDAAAN